MLWPPFGLLTYRLIATSAATTAAAITTPAAATATASGTVGPRLGNVHLEGATAMVLTVQGRNGRLGFFVSAHLHKTEAFALACGPITYDLSAFNRAVGGEHLFQTRAIYIEAHITNIKFLTHNNLLFSGLTRILLSGFIERGLHLSL